MTNKQMTDSLEQVIRDHVSLGKRNSRGWESCLHTTCDHGKKGNRAAFLFEDDTVAFHCFNCGIKTVFNPASSGNPTKFVEVLSEFGIPADTMQQALFDRMAINSTDGISLNTTPTSVSQFVPSVLDMPDDFYYLSDADTGDKWAEIAHDYISHDRLINPSDHQFMLCKKTDDARRLRWHGRVIIPVYRNNNLIFYQGRDLTGKKDQKYMNPSVSRDGVLFGFDQLYNTDEPLYVVEGIFDAMLLDGVALIGNRLNETQVYWLNKSPRQKVYIPDRHGDGAANALAAIEHGWSVSVPYDSSWDSSLKDMTDAIKHYGMLFVISEIVKYTLRGDAGRLRIGTYCN